MMAEKVVAQEYFCLCQLINYPALDYIIVISRFLCAKAVFYHKFCA